VLSPPGTLRAARQTVRPHSSTATPLPTGSQGTPPNGTRGEADEEGFILAVEAEGGIQSLGWVKSTLLLDADGDEAHGFYIVRPTSHRLPVMTPRSRL